MKIYVIFLLFFINWKIPAIADTVLLPDGAIYYGDIQEENLSDKSIRKTLDGEFILQLKDGRKFQGEFVRGPAGRFKFAIGNLVNGNDKNFETNSAAIILYPFMTYTHGSIEKTGVSDAGYFLDEDDMRLFEGRFKNGVFIGIDKHFPEVLTVSNKLIEKCSEPDFPVKITSIQYPNISRRLGEQGNVKIGVIANSHGCPTEIQLIKTSGHKNLDFVVMHTIAKSKIKLTNDDFRKIYVMNYTFKID